LLVYKWRKEWQILLALVNVFKAPPDLKMRRLNAFINITLCISYLDLDSEASSVEVTSLEALYNPYDSMHD